MSEKSMFFNSTTDDIREYSAGDFADCFSGIAPNGILEGLELSYNSGVITVSPGKAIINGYIFCMDEERNFEIPIRSYQRVDAVVLQLDMSERKISVIYKVSSEGSSPVLAQNSSVYELLLGEISVVANVAAINTAIYGDRVYSNDYGKLRNKPILYGTGTPLSSKGNDGDIYIKYQA